MSKRPQQPEQARSAHTNVAPGEHAGEVVEARGVKPRSRGRVGKVPEANRPGHHPEREQDKPSPERLRGRR